MTDISSPSPSPIRIVDVKKLTTIINAAILEVTRTVLDGRPELPKTAGFAVTEAVDAGIYAEAVSQAIDRANDDICLDPTAIPPYRGKVQDGNPITFYMMHYKLKVEAGAFFVGDLERENPKLFHGLKNAFNSKNWKQVLDEAVAELETNGYPTEIAGEELRNAVSLGNLVPLLKNAVKAKSPEPA